MTLAWTRAREIPIALAAFFTGIVVIDAFFTMPDAFSDIVVDLQRYSTIMAAMALLVAFFTILQHHGRMLVRRTPGRWYLSAITLVTMFTLTVLGFIPPITKNATYTWLYGKIYVPADIALAGVQACYIASATYRAFRAKTMDGLFCLISAFIVLFGINSPLGDMVSPVIAQIANWFILVPNMGGNRTLIFITATGMIGLTFRLLIGREKEVI
jgi:hypothetical protein